MPTLRQLRDLLADRVTVALGASGWTESTVHPALFPQGLARQASHLSFALAITSTTPGAGRRSSRAMSTSRVLVAFGYTLPTDAQLAGTAEALARESALKRAMTDRTLHPHIRPVYLGTISRQPEPDGTLLVTRMEFQVLHWEELEGEG